MRADYLGDIIHRAVNYSSGASKDLKKLMKNTSQFDRYKNKYLKIGR